VERLVVLGVPVDTIRERFVFAAPLAAANDDKLAALVERHLAADDVQVLPAIGELTDSTAARKGCALRASALADRLQAGNERRRPAMNLLWGNSRPGRGVSASRQRQQADTDLNPYTSSIERVSEEHRDPLSQKELI
jgi:hypothetical protein